MPTTRQLAAIMFTDIQGFTAMMQQDEELAVKIRDRHRIDELDKSIAMLVFDIIRDDPRYDNILERMNFPD